MPSRRQVGTQSASRKREALNYTLRFCQILLLEAARYCCFRVALTCLATCVVALHYFGEKKGKFAGGKQVPHILYSENLPFSKSFVEGELGDNNAFA